MLCRLKTVVAPPHVNYSPVLATLTLDTVYSTATFVMMCYC